MTFEDALRNFRRLRTAYDALLAVKKPLGNAWGLGLEAVDGAIEEHFKAMLEVIEEATKIDWCHPDHLEQPVTLLAEALRLLGWQGPVRRLGGNISALFGPALAVPD